MVEAAFGKIVKYILIFATFIITLGGIALLCLGIWSATEKTHSVNRMYGGDVNTVSTYVLIGVGAGIVIISMIGCCGAKKENKFKLLLFFIILFVVFLILLALAIFFFVYKPDRKVLQDSISDYGKDNATTTVWNFLQQHFQCCGLSVNGKDSYRIWENRLSNRTVPESCCSVKDKLQECDKNPKEHVFQKDCFKAIEEEYYKKEIIHVASFGAVGAFLVLGMIMTCCLYQYVRKEQSSNSQTSTPPAENQLPQPLQV